MRKDTKNATPKAPRIRRARRTARAAREAIAAAGPVTHEQIATRAYEIHLAGGGGDALEHWLRAERELTGA